MKVDGIEVLRMARDGELKPKTILKTCHSCSDIVYCNEYDYYIYYGDNQFHRCNENGKLGARFQNRFLNYEVLQKEFEIIEPVEENKEIEKINFEEHVGIDLSEIVCERINELIDEVNKLKKGE